MTSHAAHVRHRGRGRARRPRWSWPRRITTTVLAVFAALWLLGTCAPPAPATADVDTTSTARHPERTHPDA